MADISLIAISSLPLMSWGYQINAGGFFAPQNSKFHIQTPIQKQ
jgi:hypothetical protein